MKKRTRILAVVLIFCLVLSGACAEDSQLKGTCRFCGRQYHYTVLEDCSGTGYPSEHGITKCVDRAPCGYSEHYVLKGMNVDMHGQSHDISGCAENGCVLARTVQAYAILRMRPAG